MKTTQYAIADESGRPIASVWASKVEPKDDPSKGYWFYFGTEIIAACGETGYLTKDDASEKWMLTMPSQEAAEALDDDLSDEPIVLRSLDGSVKEWPKGEVR